MRAKRDGEAWKERRWRIRNKMGRKTRGEQKKEGGVAKRAKGEKGEYGRTHPCLLTCLSNRIHLPPRHPPIPRTATVPPFLPSPSPSVSSQPSPTNTHALTLLSLTHTGHFHFPRPPLNIIHTVTRITARLSRSLSILPVVYPIPSHPIPFFHSDIPLFSGSVPCIQSRLAVSPFCRETHIPISFRN